MNNPASIAQLGLTDDEIEALALKHIAPGYERLRAVVPASAPYQNSEQFRRVKALLADALHRPRAPLADERIAFETWALAEGFQPEELRICEKDGDYISVFTNESWIAWKARATLASVPVAGEAKNYPGENVAERLDNMADDQPPGSQAQSDLYAAATIWRKHIAHRAAPQASEAVRTQVLAALESAQRFIRNGIEFGYIRMPDADTPDPAHRTPGLIDAAIRSLKSQADKDGGQQRAAEASAPVAGEALNDLQALQWAEKYGIQWALHTPDAIREVIADAQRLAAPQASAEDVRNAALEQAAKLMDQTLRSNGAALIRGLKRSQADKDGGQQRAGDVDERTAWAADMVAAGAKHLGEECWEWESDDFLFHLWQVATGRKQNAALSATLAEQGERDA